MSREWSTYEPPVETATIDAVDALVRESIRSGEGFRVTVSDGRGPIATVWDVSREGAARAVDSLLARRQRNPGRDVRLVRRRAS